MSVSISNMSGRCLVFVLPHAQVCAALGRCRCAPPESRAGRPVAASLTLATGMTASGLPDAVLAAPDVVRAVQRSDVRVMHEPDAAPSPEAAPASADPQKRGSE
jgi:hypothetical protein